MLRNPAPPNEADPGPGASQSAAHLHQAHRRGRLVRLALWAAIAAGPLALVGSCASAPVPRTSAPTARPVASASPAADPAGFAQMFLSLWLRTDSAEDTGQSSALRAMAPGVDLLTNPQNTQSARTVAQTAVIRSTQIGPGDWSVVVAAELVAGPAAQLRYFAVPVSVSTAGGPVAMSVAAAPAEVASPTGPGGPAPSYPFPASPGSALVTSATGFVQAYLTGSGEVAPLLAPGAQVAALQAVPYAQTQVLSVAADRDAMDGPVPRDGTVARIWVQVTATDPAGTRWPLRYALRMRARAGRWEVAALEPGPLLASTAHTPSPAPSPTRSGLPTSP